LTLNAMGGMGMIAVGVLGGPFIGTILDRNLDRNLQEKAPVVHAAVAEPSTTKYGMNYQPLDKAKIAALPADQQTTMNQVTEDTKQGSLRLVAFLPGAMFVCYLVLIVFFASRGGYRAVELTGEQAAGGVEGPVEA
jgi:hypothetical protein